MILTVDVGNSNIVIGCFAPDNNTPMFVERITTAPNNTVLEYVVSFKTILELYGLSQEKISGVIISSVVPKLNSTLSSALEKLTRRVPLLVGAGIKTGLNIAIDNPAQLGADLVCGGVAALHDYTVPCIIFDLGTATTISVIDKNKNFLGGMIYPGVNISLNALASRASLLPDIDLDKPKRLIGTNTIDSMKSGLLYGTASLIDGFIERIETDLGYKCTTIATGGIANKIVPYCKKEVILDDTLILNGILYIYKKNI
ncbi:type III pantothenate kinase [Clostridia bacterium]|nr:type III pantothenate kinase [Clostridia bacterium]